MKFFIKCPLLYLPLLSFCVILEYNLCDMVVYFYYESFPVCFSEVTFFINLQIFIVTILEQLFEGDSLLGYCTMQSCRSGLLPS